VPTKEERRALGAARKARREVQRRLRPAPQPTVLDQGMKSDLRLIKWMSVAVLAGVVLLIVKGFLL
jgi:hypothetical protein